MSIVLPAVDNPDSYKVVLVEMPRPSFMKPVKTQEDVEREKLEVNCIFKGGGYTLYMAHRVDVHVYVPVTHRLTTDYHNCLPFCRRCYIKS